MIGRVVVEILPIQSIPDEVISLLHRFNFICHLIILLTKNFQKPIFVFYVLLKHHLFTIMLFKLIYIVSFHRLQSLNTLLKLLLLLFLFDNLRTELLAFVLVPRVINLLLICILFLQSDFSVDIRIKVLSFASLFF